MHAPSRMARRLRFFQARARVQFENPLDARAAARAEAEAAARAENEGRAPEAQASFARATRGRRAEGR